MNGDGLFFIGDGERATATLLFPPERLVSVTSATGDITSESGRDCVGDYETGSLRRLAGASMPCTSAAESYPPLTASRSSPMRRRNHSATGLMYVEDGDLHRRQVSATYVHQPHLWHGPIPRF